MASAIRVTKRTHAHQRFYEWASKNITNPTYVSEIVQRYNATIPENQADDRITPGDIGNMLIKKIGSAGAAWPLLHRPAYGVYQITTTPRLDDIMQSNARVLVSNESRAIPATPPETKNPSDELLLLKVLHRSPEFTLVMDTETTTVYRLLPLA